MCALKKDYNLDIVYNLGNKSEHVTSEELFEGVLEPAQIEEITDFVNKSITIGNAYYRIDKIEGGKDKIKIDVGIYSSSTSTKAITKKSFTFTPNVDDIALNFIKQGYLHLKTLPEFMDAIDC